MSRGLRCAAFNLARFARSAFVRARGIRTATALLGLVSIVAGVRPCDAAFSFDTAFDRVPSVNAATWLIETDVDGDGLLDLVAIGSSSHLVVHRGLAGGRLAPATPLVTFPAVIRSATSGDLNGDGHPDFVVTDVSNNAYSVLNNGDGTFKPPVWILSLFTGQAIGLGDLDGDGHQDLVAVATFGPIILMKGNGDGSLQVAGIIPTPGAVRSISVADFNGDSRSDLLAAFDSYGGSGDIHAILFYRGMSGPTLGTPVTCMTEVYGVSTMRAADLDQDGFLDAIVTGPSSSVSLLYGSSQGPVGRRLDIAVPNVVDARARDFDGDGALDLAVSSRATTEDGIVFFRQQLGGGYLRVSDCPAGRGPVGLEFLDTNEDGFRDLIAANPGSSTLAVVRGKGGFAFGGDLEIPIGNKAWDLTVGDLNRDGRPDVVVGSIISSPVRTASFLGKGDGTFHAPIYSAASSSFDPIELGDVNGDGRPDLLGASWYSYGVFSQMGDGLGQFAPGSKVGFSLPWSPSNHFDLAVADFDEDGKDDVMAATDWGLMLCLGTDGGTLAAPVTVTSQKKCVVAADLNGDGHVDVITTNSMLSLGFGSDVHVLLGNGDGTFVALPTFYAGYKPALLRVVDLTRDGIPDLVVYVVGERFMATYRGIGDGTFTPVAALPNIRTGSFDVADCDGDGKPDLVAGISDSSAVVIWPGDGTGAFGNPEVFGCRNNPDVVRCSDLDGNGLPEIVVGHHSRTVFTVLHNRGAGMPTPTLLAGVKAEVKGRHVRVTWFCDAAAFESATVQRRGETGWRDLGNPALKSAGALEFSEEADPGEYDYRLLVERDGREYLLGLVHVVVAPRDQLAILSCRWDRGASAFRMDVVIPGSAPADVTAHDVSGRTVAAMRLAPATESSESVLLRSDHRLPAGVYWIRVRQQDRVVSARSILLR